MGNKLDILVVDDDTDNGLSLAELFDIEGHRTCVAHSQEAAIAAYVANRFDVAFIDLKRPGLNGVESFLEIRKLRPQANVYMMTAFSTAEIMKQALCTGSLEAIEKPMEDRAIANLVRDLGENGVAVIPRFEADFARMLCGAFQSAGLSSQIFDRRRPVNAGRLRGVPLILDFNTTLIDTVEHYVALRSAGPVPPTVIVAGPNPPQDGETPTFRDMAITGVLNKPFDPEKLLLFLSPKDSTLGGLIQPIPGLDGRVA